MWCPQPGRVADDYSHADAVGACWVCDSVSKGIPHSEARFLYTDNMSKIFLSTLASLTLSGTFLSSSMVAGENQMMHCFAFTAKADATPADWAAFYAATNALPKKMPLVKSVWVGKLRRPLTQYAPDAETAKLFKPDVSTATGPVNRLMRQYGACFAMENGGADTLKAYTAHPYHAEWAAAYEKVRVSGTTTYDIMGQ